MPSFNNNNFIQIKATTTTLKKEGDIENKNQEIKNKKISNMYQLQL